MPERPIDVVRSAIEQRTGPLKAKGRYLYGRCPAHDDQNDSLSVFEGEDGAACLRCFAGCTQQQILAAIGLQLKDRYPQADRPDGTKRSGRQQSRNFRRRVAGEEVKVAGELVGFYPYHDSAGREQYRKNRWKMPDKPDGRPDKTFTTTRQAPNKHTVHSLEPGWYEYSRSNWYKLDAEPDPDRPPNVEARWFDSAPVLVYRLPEVEAAINAGWPVWVCEGEKDVEAFRAQGEVATTNRDGASSWSVEHAAQLLGAQLVTIVADNDEAGLKGAIKRQDTLLALEPAPVVRVVRSDRGKDPWDHFAKGGTLADFVEIDPQAELDALAVGPTFDVTAVGAPSAPVPPSSLGTDPPGPTGSGSEDDGDEWRPPMSDLDNAELMRARHGADLRFCAPFNAWFVYRRGVWEEDQSGTAMVLQRWIPLAREIVERASDMPSAPKPDRYAEDSEREYAEKVNGAKAAAMRHAKKCLEATGWKNMMTLLPGLRGVPVLPEELDQHHDLLPVENGLMNLRTGEVVPDSRDYLMTKRCPVRFDPDADCPTWVGFLDQALAGDAELIDYLRLVAGYLLTGEVVEQQFWFVYGPAGTGKSKFVSTLRALLGPLCVQLDPKHLMAGRHGEQVPEHLARLKGARMVLSPEVNQGDRFDEGLVKRLTGEDVITARRMRENSFDFRATFKMVVTGNYRPRVDDQGESFWRRIRPIGFEVHPPEVDQYFGERLLAELPGILNWALSGARDWYAGSRLVPPKSVAGGLEEYREEVDTLGRFLRDKTVVDSFGSVQSTALYKLYEEWTKEEGEWKMTHTKFSTQLKQRGLEKVRNEKGVFWIGLAATSEVSDSGSNPTGETLQEAFDGDA